MNKKEIQKRVSQNGKPLALNKFTWCEETKTFSSDQDNLVIDFSLLDNCTINCKSSCAINCGRNCTIDCGRNCTIDCGGDCVLVFRDDKTNVIKPEEGQIIQTPPYNTIEGFIVDGMYDGSPYIIADGILSKVINKKGDVYKVINHGETEKSYIVKSGDVYSHGETIKQAREDLVYKLSDRDTLKYDNLTMDTVLTKEECIQMYMTITGACSSGTKYFVNNQTDIKDEYTVSEIIYLTQGQYNHSALVEFMEGK